MLNLIVWTGVYTLFLWGLGRSVGSCRRRLWFKVLFLPGTLVGALLQLIAALICLGSVKELHFFCDGKPFLELARSRIPYLGAGLFVLVAHGLLFGVFFFGASQIESAGVADAHSVTLPDLSSYDLVNGDVDISFGPCLGAVTRWLVTPGDRPLGFALTLYVVFSVFVSMSLTGQEWRRGAIVLALLGAVTCGAAWLGVGFSLFSRGWWISWLHLSGWWSVFSLFLALAAASCLLVLGVQPVFALCRRIVRPLVVDGGSKSKRRKQKKRSKDPVSA